MKILIIEDDQEILNLLHSGFRANGFKVDTTTKGLEGVALAHQSPYDLLILDSHLPDKSGDEICRQLRAGGIEMPILILSVNDKSETVVNILNLGADDCVAKPFCFKELLARVRALLRRPKQISPEILTYESVTLDSQNQIVQVDNKEVILTLKEYQLLEHLMRNRGSIISKVNLLESVWGSKTNLFSNTLETHVLNLRKKLGSKNAGKHIKTISGRGYRIG